MENKTIRRVNEISAKALKDETDWSAVYKQTDEAIQKNSDSDPDAPTLKHAVYKKSNTKR